MRKLKLFFAALALLVGGSNSVWAQETPANDGIYYIYNESSGLFLTRGENWGTQAVAKPIGLPWKVSIPDGKYTLRMYDLTVAGSTTGFGSNGYTDNESPIQFTPAGDATTGFTLQDGNNYITCPSSAGPVSLSTTSSAWKFLTQAQYDAVLAAKVTAQEEAIATAKGITIPAGKTLNDVVTDVNNWVANAPVNDGLPTSANWTATNHTDRQWQYINWGNYGTEMYQVCNGHYARTITGLKKGIYKVSVRAMKRIGSNENCYTMGQAGYPVSDSYLSANGNIIRIKAWYENCVNEGNPNSTGEFVSIANNGGYITEGFVYVGSDGKLVLDVASEAYWGSCWLLFNGISYTFYNNEVSDEDATTILSQATTLESKKMKADVLSELSSAKTTFDGAHTIANYNTLSTAITNANTSVTAYTSAKAYFDLMDPIMDNTNVYTADSYNTYYATPKSKYEDGTLTNEEANALKLTIASNAWHWDNTLDEILLSTWTIGGEQAVNYNKSLYINTWSVEGNTDGSEFHTPFFEYWVSSGSLEANTITSTLTGLKANTTYSFTIRARVQGTTEKKAKGITMKVGDGEAVDISAGSRFNNGNFYIGNFSAVGETDDDGKLVCTITVAENSNISWLSFYNCKYTEGEDLSAYIADYEFALSTAQGNNNNTAYDAITGKEKADLETAITTYASVDNTDKAALIKAKNALETASNTFVSAVYDYTTLVDLNENVATKLGVTLPTVTSTTTAADINAKDFVIAVVTAAKAYKIDATSQLGDWSATPKADQKGESWDGTTTDTYYDSYNGETTMTQTVILPAGDYALIFKCRASAAANVNVTDGTNTVRFAHKGNTGRGIATDGTATFADAATYARNGAGQGWEYRVLTFTSDGTTATTLTFNWNTKTNLWAGLDDIELRANPIDITISENTDYTPVNSYANVTLNRTIKAKGETGIWNTIFLPFSLTDSETKAAFGSDTEIANYSEAADGETSNSTVNFTLASSAAITANTPVLLRTSTAGTSYSFDGKTIKAGEAKVAGTNFDFVGTYAASTTIAEGDYFLSSNKLYRSKGTTTIKGTRAYIKAKEAAASARISKFFIDGIEATNIEGLTVSGAANGKIYNLNGQEVKTPKKGLYIQNGKKISIK